MAALAQGQRRAAAPLDASAPPQLLPGMQTNRRRRRPHRCAHTHPRSQAPPHLYLLEREALGGVGHQDAADEVAAAVGDGRVRRELIVHLGITKRARPKLGAQRARRGMCVLCAACAEEGLLGRPGLEGSLWREAGRQGRGQGPAAGSEGLAPRALFPSAPGSVQSSKAGGMAAEAQQAAEGGTRPREAQLAGRLPTRMMRCRMRCSRSGGLSALSSERSKG